MYCTYVYNNNNVVISLLIIISIIIILFLVGMYVIINWYNLMKNIIHCGLACMFQELKIMHPCIVICMGIQQKIKFNCLAMGKLPGG